MLLRSISRHLKEQNWFALGLDFFIVVVGILIAFQVTNWNEAKAEKLQEAAILTQLEDEFIEIQTTLEKQLLIREGYVASLKRLIVGLEGSASLPEKNIIEMALVGARATGRRPAQSAAYLQLTTSGDLSRLSNQNLKNALISYHSRLERDAFLFPELTRIVIQEITSNTFVDYDVSAAGTTGAAIDMNMQPAIAGGSPIRSYDINGLRQYEQRYEALYLMHGTLVDTDQTQLELVKEILKQVSEQRG